MSDVWMPAQTTRPPFLADFRANGTSAPTGAKMIAASIGSGRNRRGGAGPGAAQVDGEPLRGLIMLAGEGKDLAALSDGKLR